MAAKTPLEADHFQGGANLTESDFDGLAAIINEIKEALGTFTFPAIATGTVTANTTQRIRYDASGGTFQINAPASPAPGDRFGIKEIVGDATDVTIAGNGNDIEDPAFGGGFETSFTIGLPRVGVEFEFDGTQWIIP